MNSFTQLVQNVKDANWQGAGQVFKEIMQQKVADRLDVERRTIFKEDTIPFSSDYKKYFDSMLKKWNVSSPKDIPADKKDDFFKAVDKGYKAKNESCGLKHEVTDDEAEGKALLDEPYPKEVDEDDNGDDEEERDDGAPPAPSSGW
jgi:hypothetical protein